MHTSRILSLPLMLLALTATAQTIDEGEALDKALTFITSQQQAHGLGAAPRLTLAHKSAAEGETYYYAFNNPDGGFVIVGGDATARDILGYSDSGSFHYDQLPPDMKWWLSEYEQAIRRAIRRVRAGQMTIAPDATSQRRAKAAWGPNIDPLLHTRWDQWGPYNGLLPGNESKPLYDEGAFVTGCVATAVAQVMNYHQWPASGIGRRVYELHFDDEGTLTYNADFAHTDYDWAHMQDTYTLTDTYHGTTAEHAVAELMYHVGVAVGMAYDYAYNGGSGAMVANVPSALSTYFRYSSDAQYWEREEFPDDDTFEYYVWNELNEQRPVIYGGQSEEGGHCFVVDGYKTQGGQDLYHINWGWSGLGDGYFPLTGTGALLPDVSGAGGAGEEAAYIGSQEVILGLTPDPSNEGFLYAVNSLTMGNNGYGTGEFSFELDIANPTSRQITDNVVFWIYLVKDDGGYPSVAYIYESDQVFAPGETKHYTFDQSQLYHHANEASDKFEVGHDYLMDVSTYPGRVLLSNMIDYHYVAPLNVSYTLSQAEWGTLCLPYDAPLPAGMTAYKVTGVNGNGTLVRTQADRLEMNKAYLVNGTPGTYHFSGPNTGEGVYPNGLLWGVTKRMGDDAPQNAYVLQDQAGAVAFYRVNLPYTIRVPHYGAYLQTPAPMGARILIDQETGIHGVTLTEGEAAPMLNLLGQPTSASLPGLRIEGRAVTFRK